MGLGRSKLTVKEVPMLSLMVARYILGCRDGQRNSKREVEKEFQLIEMKS